MNRKASSEDEGNVIQFPSRPAAPEEPAVQSQDELPVPQVDRRAQEESREAIRRRHPAGIRLPEWQGAVGDHYGYGPRGNGFAVWLLDQPDEPVLWFPPHSQLGAFLAFQDLERHEARRSRSYLWRRPLLAAAVASIVLLGTVVTLQLSRLDGTVRSKSGGVTAESPAADSGGGTSVPVTGGDGQQPRLQSKLSPFVNEQAGYAFSYPRAWGMDTKGSAARVVSPGGEVALTFRAAPDGSVGQASDVLVGSLSTGYRDIQLQTPQVERTAQGLPAVVTAMRATDPVGRDVRFLSITIHGGTANWAVLVRFAERSNVLRFMPAIRQIVDSFRLTEG